MQKAYQLLLYCEPIFNTVLVLRPEFTVVNEDFRCQLILACERFEQAALQAALQPEKVHAVKYALVAYLDEWVSMSQVPGCEHWPSQSLQLHFFNSNIAGEGFFHRLQQLCEDVALNIDVISVYLLCLRLGFKGKYAVDGEEALKAITHEVIQKSRLVV